MTLKELRLKEGLDHKSLAEKMGVGINTVFLWESGRSFPRFKNQKKLFDLFGEMPDIGKNTSKDISVHIEDLEELCKGIEDEQLKGLISFKIGRIKSCLKG